MRLPQRAPGLVLEMSVRRGVVGEPRASAASAANLQASFAAQNCVCQLLFFDGTTNSAQVLAKGCCRIGGAPGKEIGELQLRAQ